MLKQQELLERIQAEFQPHFVTVENESHKHSSGRGADSHFKLVIVSDAFEGMRKVQRHQKLYQLFADDLKKWHSCLGSSSLYKKRMGEPR